MIDDFDMVKVNKVLGTELKQNDKNKLFKEISLFAKIFQKFTF